MSESTKETKTKVKKDNDGKVVEEDIETKEETTE